MTSSSPVFAARTDKDAVETGAALAPMFDRDGLIVAIAADAATGEAWFWSRSRQKLWRKGEESGNTLAVAEMRG